MLRTRSFWLVCILLCSPVLTQAGEVLTPKEAAAKVGMKVKVYLQVRAVGTTTQGSVELLSEGDVQHPDAFFIRIPTEVKDKFKELKVVDFTKHFNQQFIRVTGTVRIANYTNIGKRPVIEIDAPGAIEIIDPEAAHPLSAEIAELYKSGKLFQRTAYKEVRAAFARRFETNHQADLKLAYGPDYQEITDWLAKNPDIKENLYTAILEQDDVPKALALFKEIWKRHPDTLQKWSQLAIAVAITWDQPRGIYDYRSHQLRVQSNLTGEMVEALGNYKYIVDNEKRMPQPVYLYPWEFLVFVVNHRTPLPERQWAHTYFQTAKIKSKSWHKDVPYDFEIIKREIDKDPSAGMPKLAGKDYTLANILTYGGVCAHQADFACRTAKSLGIPAVYCAGASAYRDRHAWWMFVNVTSATKDEIKFSLTSDGRFDGKDNYYTGEVLEPQTGKIMLDRDMERRLWVAGTDRAGKRLAALIMRAYPMLAETNAFTVKEKADYLDQCIKVSKYNEDAWINFARMAKRGEFTDENKKIGSSHLASLKEAFAAYPDFTWRIFDDLVETAAPAEKIKQCEGLLAQFEKSKRADLACDARLKLTELLIAEAKFSTAQTGLTASIKKFPTEGRYVPRMLKKLEEVAPQVKGGPAQLAQLYYDIVPNMVIYYRSENNIYFKKMRDQAKDFFAQNNLPQADAILETRISQARLLVAKTKAK